MIAFSAHRPTIMVTETWLPDGSDMLTNLAAMGVPVIALTTDPTGSAARSAQRASPLCC
jgi:formate dehydrogenase assembly factor FdhD